MQVYLDEDVAFDMLMERLSYWTDNNDVHQCFEEMYTRNISSGLYEGSSFNPQDIVDNDYVNWCNIIWNDEEKFQELIKTYEKGEREAVVDGIYYYIEGVSDNKLCILVRG